MKQVFNVLILPLLALTVFSGCSGSRYPSLNILYRDYQAQRDVKKERYEDALAKYYAMLEDDGERASTHSNIGVILNSLQKPDEALKSLQHALKMAEAQSDPEMIFKVRYNLGVYFGAQKNIPLALEHYQAALDIVPGSKEVKTNIELLLQQQKQNKNGKEGEQKKDNQSQEGQDKNKDKKPGDDQKDKKDQKDQNKDNKDQKDDKDSQDKKEEQKKESSPKYQPRPFKGEQLSEGDVKKILGELKNQEQKIRANFDKKEKGKSRNNEKDW